MNDEQEGTTPASQTRDDGLERAANPSMSRRERLDEIRFEFSRVQVKPGTQQAAALEKVRQAAETFAKQISELGPKGEHTDLAIQKVMEAKMWAIQSITHRNRSTGQ